MSYRKRLVAPVAGVLLAASLSSCAEAERQPGTPDFTSPSPSVGSPFDTYYDPMGLPGCSSETNAATLGQAKGGVFPEGTDPFVVVDDGVQRLGSAALSVEFAVPPETTPYGQLFVLGLPDEGLSVEVTERSVLGNGLATIQLVHNGDKVGDPACEVIGFAVEVELGTRAIMGVTMNGPEGISEYFYYGTEEGVLMNTGEPVTLEEAAQVAATANAIADKVFGATGGGSNSMTSAPVN